MELDLSYAGIIELAAAYRARSVSPVEVARHLLDRIARFRHLSAYITLTERQALEAAKRAETEFREGIDRGPLQGVPFAVKDQILTAGIRTTAGSAVLRAWVPETDATAVARLEGAGAVLLGKLNMMEFGLGRPRRYTYGTPRNPWDLTRETGGSSSGSGSAPAAGLAVMTLGEDTGGSIRHPAAHCGIVGLRPTWGRVSRFGLIPAVWPMDTIGPTARSVEDVAHVLGVVAGADPLDPTSLGSPVEDYAAVIQQGIAGLRGAVVRELANGPELTPEGASAFDEAIGVLRREGMVIGEVSIPLAFHAGVIYTSFAEGLAALAHRDQMRAAWDRYDPHVRIRLARGLLAPGYVALWAAGSGREALVSQVESALREHDVLLSPTTPGPAPTLASVERAGPLTAEDVRREFALQSYRMPFSFHGGPTLALGCGFTRDGLPLSLQVVGARERDDVVLRVGHAFQRSTAWHLRRPSMPDSLPAAAASLADNREPAPGPSVS